MQTAGPAAGALEKTALEERPGGQSELADLADSNDGPALVMRGLLRPFTLLLLGLESAHGYRLKQRLELAGLRPEPGGLYRLLHRLEGEGYVDSSTSGLRGDRGRRVYRLTAGGVEHLKAEVEALDHTAELLGSFSRDYRQLVEGARASGRARLPGTPLEEVGLAARAAECLRRDGIRTLEEVAVLTERDLSRQGLWVGDIRQIVAALARRGLSLRYGTLGGPPRSARGSALTEASFAQRSARPTQGQAPSQRTERDLAIIQARERGDTLQEVGDRFAISRERVRQILARSGATDPHKSKGARAQRQLEAAEVRREEVLAAWRAGSGPAAIAARLGLRRACVSSLIEMHATAADRAARRLAQSGAASRVQRAFSDQSLLDALKRVVEASGRVPSSKEYGVIARAEGMPSLSTIENRFGGWNAALRAAGLTPTPPRRGTYRCRWTEESCLEALRGLATEPGGLPTQHDYDELARGNPELPSRATLRIRVGSWGQLAVRLERDARKEA